ncbi:MAG: MltA domain-containing protein [Thermodesulfobacteriota bacterium]
MSLFAPLRPTSRQDSFDERPYHTPSYLSMAVMGLQQRLGGGRLIVGLALAGALLLAPPPAAAGPALADDADPGPLVPAIHRSLSYLARLPPDRFLAFGDVWVAPSWLTETLLTLLAVLRLSPTPQDLAMRLAENFDALPAAGESALVTAYFEPVYEGRLAPDAPFLHPLHRRPPDLVPCPQPADASCLRFGRYQGDRFVPHFSRAEITAGALASRELVYLADPVDAFVLAIQGSGRIRLADGSVRPVHYQATNGHPYRSIGRVLIERGLLSREEATLPGIRRFLAAHPDQCAGILNENPSYVFFDWAADGPAGSLGEILTPGRSVATDARFFPRGAPGWLATSQPLLDERGQLAGFVPLARLVLSQDTGGAIQGPGRVDLFWGSGADAEAAAGLMRQPGTLFLLLKKGRD